jgi:SAM-dependent methyltransferase
VRSWYPNELDTAGPEHLDADFVAGYDAKAQFDPTEDVDILTGAGIDGTATVVDLGAGTGTFASAMAPHVASVLAVDPSPEMIAHIRARADPDVTAIEAGFLTWEVGPGPVEAVFSRNALHQLPDFWKVTALRRIAAALRDDGVFRLRDLIFDFDPGDIDDAIDAWLQFAGDDPTQGYTAPEFVTHLRSEHSTFTWLLEPMLERVGFEIVDKTSSIGIYTAYTCRKRP